MHYQREHYFNSFDEFNSAPHGWDTDFSTTSKKNYRVSLKQSAAPGLLLNTAWLSSPTLQKATTPTGMRTFALPLRLQHAYCWRGLSVNENTFMAFPSDRELFSLMGADSEVLTVSVDKRLVDRCLQNWDINPDELFQLPRTADLSALQYRAMRRNLQMMSEFMVKYGNLQQFPDLSRGIRDLLIEDMLQPVLGQLDYPAIGTSAAARRVKKAADYILSRLDQAITVDDVCKQVGCSRRSLEQGFKQHAGTSPKQFIQLMRLEHCRKALLAATPDSQVNQIASQHGFWHMGQFAAAYRNLFGESPSQTLRASAKH